MVDVAQQAEQETEDRNKEELNDMKKQAQFRKGCAQRMAKMLIEPNDLVGRAHKVMQEANVAKQRSCSKLRMFQRRLGLLQDRSETGRRQCHNHVSMV